MRRINIVCPACANTIVAKYKGEIVTGKLQHKCRVCKRYWDLNYTTKQLHGREVKRIKPPSRNSNWIWQRGNGNQ